MRHHRRYRAGEKAVTTADIEDPFVLGELEPRDRFVRHRALQAADSRVILAAPVDHPRQLTRKCRQVRAAVRIRWHSAGEHFDDGIAR